MAINIVSSQQVANLFKTCRHFVKNMGLIATVEKNGQRIYNDKDRFSNFYNRSYNTTIFAQGYIGNIRFYVDHMIIDRNFAVYVGDSFEEFVNTYDYDLVNEKGIEFYIGHLLKSAEEAYEEKKKNDELRKIEVQKGDANKINLNPGQVTYEDLKAYMEKQQSERYKKNLNL
jgi:hypothetical protein